MPAPMTDKGWLLFRVLCGEGVFGDAGIEDAAMDVRQLKSRGIRVMAVFYGLDSDLEGARKIYRKRFCQDQGRWGSLRIRLEIC